MTNAEANWHQDPTQRHELRYWDGTVWTEHVSDNGITGRDPLEPRGFDRVDQALTVGHEGDPAKLEQQLHGVGARGAGIEGFVAGGGGSIFDEPILIVNQKAKIIELNNQYRVFDQGGNEIAQVEQVGQTKAKKALRLLTSFDQYMTHKLQIRDASGRVVLQLTRPAKVFKSTVIVSDGDDCEIGQVVQENMVGKINFAFMAGGQRLGAIKGENWRAWNFRIEDAAGNEIARITKTFEGVAKTLFTTADNYVLQVHRRPPEPLNALVVASALSVDTALKQDKRGFG